MGRLPNGEAYGMVRKASPAGDEGFPLIIPEQRPKRGEDWYVFGALPDDVEDSLPVRPGDPFAAFGAMPGEPETLAKRYTLIAYLMEIAGGLFLLIGMALNILFIVIIIYLLQ